MSCTTCNDSGEGHGKGYKNFCAAYNAALCEYLPCQHFTSAASTGCSGYLRPGDLDCPQEYTCGPWPGPNPNPNTYDMEGDISRLLGRCIVGGQAIAITFKKCCEVAYGGTISYAGCVRPSCCGCDWCCNEIDSADCLAQKSYSWENLPIPKSEACSFGSCPELPPSPVCRREEFALGRRPVEHEPPESGVGVGRINRHELHSQGRIRAIDRAPPTEECRTYYAHMGPGDAVVPLRRNIGWLCGQRNWRDSTSKRANRCYPSKRPDGRHSFNCAYRIPCPEKPC
jgi:hypothetical protein